MAGSAVAGCGASTELGWEGAPGRGGAGHGGSSGGGAGGMAPAWFACKDVSECTLRRNQCCEGCSITDVSDATAVNRQYVTALGTELCRQMTTPCPATNCGLPTVSYVAVQCRQNRCQAVDIRQDQLSACTVNGDCHLRYGTGCCEGSCAASSVPPVGVATGYELAVCGSAGICGYSCPMSSLYVPFCSGGHCIAAQ
jgi:hypothetical protein